MGLQAAMPVVRISLICTGIDTRITVLFRDPRIPTETVLSQKRSVYSVNLDDYKMEVASNLSEAWELARENILVAQEQQKTLYNKKSRIIDMKVGDRVMVYMPGELLGKDLKNRPSILRSLPNSHSHSF